MVTTGSVVRLWMHYDAPPLPMYTLATAQAQITYSAVTKAIVSPVDQQYVALSCDTDGAFAANFRFGFNGQ